MVNWDKYDDWKNKNKKKSTKSTDSVDWEKYDARSTIGFDTLNDDINNLNTYLKSMESGWQDSETMKKNKDQLSSIVNRLSTYKKYLTDYGNDNDETKKYSKQISDMYDSYNNILNVFDEYANEYGKFTTKDEYEKSVAFSKTGEEGIKARKEWYESSKEKLKELDDNVPWYEKIPVIGDLFDDYNTLNGNDRREELQAYINEYERGKKVTDDYYDITKQSNFSADSQVRDYDNPTREELRNYDSDARNANEILSNGGYFDEDGKIRNSSGEIVSPDELPIADKLGMFLSASPDEIAEAYSELSAGNGNYTNTWANLMQEGDTKRWKYLDPTDIGIYYTLLKNEGQESAYKFLDDMEVELGRREEEAIKKEIDGSSALEKIAYNVASVPANVFGGAAAFIGDVSNFIQGEEYNPYSAAHRMQSFGQAVRESTAEDINDLTGNMALPYVGTTFGDVYQSLMSGADSVLGASLLGGGYTFLMGMGSASSEAKELYDQGATTGQIMAGGILAGTAEALFEKVSLDHFLKIKDTKTMGQLIKQVLLQGGVEASEEVATEIANTLTNAIVMGSQSDWAKYRDKYLSEGYSDVQATVKALFNDVAPNVINAGIGGLISGGAMAGIGSGINLARYNSNAKKVGKSIYNKGNAESLIESTRSLEDNKTNSKLKAIAEQLASTDTSNGKPSSKYYRSLGKLYDNTSTAQRVQLENSDKQAFAKSVRAELESRGIENVDEATSVLTKAMYGQLNSKEAKLYDSIGGNDILNKVLNSDRFTDDKAETFTTNLVNTVKTNAMPYVDNGDKTTTSESNDYTEFDYNTDGKTIINKADGTSEDVNIKKIASVENGKLMLEIDNGDIVDAKNVSFASESDAIVYESILNMGASAESGNVIISVLKGSNISDQKSINNAMLAYSYGLTNQEDMMSSLSLPDNAKSILFKAGRKDATARAENMMKKAQSRTVSKKASNKVNYVNEIDHSRLNGKQKALIETADFLAESTPMDIYIFESYKRNGKNYVNINGVERETTANGWFVEGTNKIYIDINAGNDYSGLGLFTLAHELGHYIRDWNATKWLKMADLIVKEINNQAKNDSSKPTFKDLHDDKYSKYRLYRAKEQALIDKGQLDPKKADYAGKSDQELRDMAYEDVICDSLASLMTDKETFVQFANKLEKADKTLWEKLKDFIKSFLDKLDKALKSYDGVQAENEAGKAIQNATQEIRDQIRELYLDAFIGANENYNNASKTFDESASDIAIKVATDSLKFNERYEDEQHLADLEKYYNPHSAVSLDKIKEISTSVTNLWKKITGDANSDIVNEWNNLKGTDRVFTIFKAQTGYKYNAELSSMCKKGIPLFEAIDTIVKKEVIDRLKTKTLGLEEKKVLYSILQSKGFEIPCAICYVEQSRQREGEIIKKFLNGDSESGKIGWNSTISDIEKRMKALGADYTFPNLDRKVATDMYSVAKNNMDEKTQKAFEKALLDATNEAILYYNEHKDKKAKARQTLNELSPTEVKRCLGGTLASNLKIFKVLMTEPQSRFKVDDDLLYSSMTTRNIAKLHKNFYSLFNSQGGVSGAKSKQKAEIYWGDILKKKWSGSKLRNEGGLRNQSNSDFQMLSLLDQAQMYVDLTAKAYYLQAYTKTLTELKLFGLSNAKINASLIPLVHKFYLANGQVDVEKTRENAGLDANGNPIYDDIEGINHKEYEMLHSIYEYSKSIGGICIGYSDKHIWKLLDDDNVSLIIGFHDKTNDTSKRYRGAEFAKNYNGENEATYFDADGDLKTVHLSFSEFLNKAEKMFKKQGEDFVGTAMYNGTKYDATNIPRLATAIYLDYCKEKGYFPAYKQFSGHKNYYKLLADFSLFDNKGDYAPHKKVNFSMPSKVPSLDINGKVTYESSKDYIKNQLKAEIKVQEEIASAMAEEGKDSIIEQFVDRVNNPEKYVNKNSERDSDGNELSEGQIEYFKDSKVRDENGNLLVVYHGTPNKFTIFNQGTAEGWGRGIYFTDIKEETTYYGENVVEAYVNITNPFDTRTMSYRDVEVLGYETNAYKEFDYKQYQKYGKYDYDSYKEYQEDGQYTDMFMIYEEYIDVFNSILRELGYDGIIGDHTNNINGLEIVAFNENQPKLTTNLNPTSDPDIRYSERDSDGNELSEGQIEYFKDSKVRDENGNLIPMYHGTSADFTVFDKGKIGSTGRFEGSGFNFTPYKSRASSYSNTGNVLSGYLNVTKPLSAEKKTFSVRKLANLIAEIDPTGDNIISNYAYETRDYGKTSFIVRESLTTAKAIWDYCENDADIYAQLSNANPDAETLIDAFEKMGYDGVIHYDENGKIQTVISFEPEQFKNKDNLNPTSDPDIRYSERVTDKETLDFLNKQEKNGDVIVTYKSMQIIDGKLYSPMAAKVKGDDGKYHLTPPNTLGVWQQAVEDTSNIKKKANGKWYYTLNKGNGKSIDAAYNPYEHSSNLVLNDQFEEAYQRPNLVTVECIIPKSEMTSGYKAQYAKDSTGYIDWKAGTVAGKLSDNQRKVYLSRWLKPIRILSDAEVASKYKEILSKDNISVPFNVVTPGLLSELEKAGVPIDYEGSPSYKLYHESKNEVNGAKYSDRDIESYDRTAILKESTIDTYLKDYASKTTPKYAQAYIAYMSPNDFLNLTTKYDKNRIIEESRKLDKTKFEDATIYQPIQLKIDTETGMVEGHEGRHRMVALYNAGIESVPVLMFDSSNKYNKEHIDSKYLFGQFDIVKMAKINDVVPFNYANREEIVNKFGTQSAVQKMQEKYNGKETFRYDERDYDISNRTLLANALESATKNDIEKNKLKAYKEKIDLINAEEKKLSETRSKIKELSFAKGPKDAKQISKLQAEATKTANRINVYDKQLLSLEASTPLKNVLQREREMVKKREAKRYRESLNALREKEAETRREIVSRYQESRKKAVESRNKTVVRNKIKKVVSDLNQLLLHGTKDKHILEGMQRTVAEALDMLNMDTVGADERIAKYDALIAKATDPEVIESLNASKERIRTQGENMSEKINKLKLAYADIKNSSDSTIANAFDEVIVSKIESLSEKIGNTSLRDMSIEQLEDVYDTYKMILTSIRKANKAFKTSKNESIEQLGNAVQSEVYDAGGSHERQLALTKFIKKQGWNSLKPIYAMRMIGSDTLTGLFNNLLDGQGTWYTDMSDAKAFRDENVKYYHFNDWDFKKQYTFKAKSGKQFSMNLNQIMSLYAYSKRNQAIDHLVKGGIVFDNNIEVIEKKKGIPLKYTVNTADAFNLSEVTIGEIISNLTDEQKAFVDSMQAYLSDTMGAKGNEVSLELYGVKLFKEKFYFPLKSAKQYMFEQNEVAGEVRVKNSGFSKETVAHANNPIIISNFMDVWASHVNDMSMYHAFVLPLEDFNRVFNYRTRTDENLETMSVKETLQNAYGDGVNEYIRNLITDLNGGARSQAGSEVINKLMGKFKKGAVFASASVTIQQPSAIARAMAYINPKYFVTSIPKQMNFKKHNADWEECKKYAPVAGIKEMGYFDTGMGQSSIDWINSEIYEGFRNKLGAFFKDGNYRDSILSKAPALADEVTWCHIWNAVKKEVADTTDLTVGTDEFFKQCGKRFSEVIELTQVYDSVLTRSGLMRSKDTGMKMATAFMAEPTTTINMIADAFVQGKRLGKAKGAKFIASSVGAVVGSIVINSLLKSIVMAWRDDDDDKSYGEKYADSLSSDLISNLNPLSMIPIVKDVLSVFQGYDVSRADMNLFNDLYKAFNIIDSEKKSTYQKVTAIIGAVSAFFGVPFKNVERDLRPIIAKIFDIKKED